MGSVDVFGLTSFALMAGYSPSLSENLCLTSLVGGGYITHYMEGEALFAFLDPQLRFEIDVDIVLLKDLYNHNNLDGTFILTLALVGKPYDTITDINN